MENRLTAYGNYLAGTEKAENTTALYIREAAAFIQYIGDKTVTKTLVMEYKDELMEKYSKPSTINAKIIAINSYLKFTGQGACTVKTIKLQSRQCLENVLSRREYNKMLEYVLESGRKKHYLIMRTLALTGCRIGELEGVTIQALADGGYKIRNKGKIRDIYLPDKLVKELEDYCREKGIQKGYVFTGRKGKPITSNGVYRMMQKIADMTGVPLEKAHPHSLRHLFALTYIDTYNNIGELADILGHSSLEITRIYLSSSREEKRNKMNRLNL